MCDKVPFPGQGPVSQKSRKLFGPVKPKQNLKPYDYRAVSPFLDTNERKMALQTQKVSGTFKKQAPELEPRLLDLDTRALTQEATTPP